MRLRISIAKRIDLDQQEGALNEDDAFERCEHCATGLSLFDVQF